jgi:muramoyltetrapeptide carboxypeptidase
MPNLAGSILFLEDSAEPPYRIDRMLTQLIGSGHLDGVAGIVFGKMHKCDDPYNDLKLVLEDLLHFLPVPIALGLESGHGPRNRAIRLAAPALLDSDSKSISIA